jgi:hypothetical protein
MTRAEAFSEREMAMCAVARMVEDGKTYWAAGGGTPLYSVLLGKSSTPPKRSTSPRTALSDRFRCCRSSR